MFKIAPTHDDNSKSPMAFKIAGMLVLGALLATVSPARADLLGGTVKLFDSLGTLCPSPCTSGFTTITVETNPTDDTVELTIVTGISTPDGADQQAPTLLLDFDINGRPTSQPIRFIEHWQNTGPLAWEEAAQTAVPLHYNPNVFPIIWGAGDEVIAPPLSVQWANLTSNPVAGGVKPGFEQPYYLPETLIASDPVLGDVTIPAGTIAGAVFQFNPLLQTGQSATLVKDLLFLLEPQSCDDFQLGCESGVVQVAINFAPAALPLPPALALFGVGVVLLAAAGRHRSH